MREQIDTAPVTECSSAMVEEKERYQHRNTSVYQRFSVLKVPFAKSKQTRLEMVLCGTHNEMMELLATEQVDVNSLGRSSMGIEF